MIKSIKLALGPKSTPIFLFYSVLTMRVIKKHITRNSYSIGKFHKDKGERVKKLFQQHYYQFQIS